MEQNLDIRHLSSEQFALIGMQEVAYIKPVPLPESAKGYGIFAADGRQLGVAPSMDLAQALIRQNELEPVLAH